MYTKPKSEMMFWRRRRRRHRRRKYTCSFVAALCSRMCAGRVCLQCSRSHRTRWNLLNEIFHSIYNNKINLDKLPMREKKRKFSRSETKYFAENRRNTFRYRQYTHKRHAPCTRSLCNVFICRFILFRFPMIRQKKCEFEDVASDRIYDDLFLVWHGNGFNAKISWLIEKWIRRGNWLTLSSNCSQMALRTRWIRRQ